MRNNFKYSILDLKECNQPNQVGLMKHVTTSFHESLAIYNKENKQVTVWKINELTDEDLEAVSKFIRGMKEYYEE